MEKILLYTLQAITIINILSYAWSVIGVFKKHSEMNFIFFRSLQIFSILQWVLMIRLIVIIENESATSILIALITQIMSLIIFWSHSKIVKENEFTIIFSLDQPKKLIQKGLYKYIRHPFYCAYLLSYFSIALCWMDPITIGCSLVILYLYYKGSELEENKFLNSPLRDAYSEYQKSTGRFFPFF